MNSCNQYLQQFISQICFKYAKLWIETICEHCMSTCFSFHITTCLTLYNKLSFIWFLDTWVNTQIETQLNPCSWYLNQNISTIIMLSFNSPKPIRALDALSCFQSLARYLGWDPPCGALPVISIRRRTPQSTSNLSWRHRSSSGGGVEPSRFPAALLWIGKREGRKGKEMRNGNGATRSK